MNTEVTIETEAKALGWVPQEQFKGDAAKWVDAETFVKRGREQMPLLRANHEKLMQKVDSLNAEIAALRESDKTSKQTVEDLKKFHQSEVKRQVEARLKELKDKRALARKEGDEELADELTDEIAELKTKAEAPAPAASPTPAPPPNEPPVEPWAQEFYEANKDWLGKDKRRTGLFSGIADDLYAKGLRGAELLAKAKEELEATLNPTIPGLDKTEGGRGGGGSGGGRSGGKSYADLPAEAKAQCDADERKFVGDKGKAFKSQAEWRKHYAETFFATE